MSFPQIRMGIEPTELLRRDSVLNLEGMRRAIHQASHESALVRNVMVAADANGMNGEDRYTMLAYHALVALETYYKKVLDVMMKDPHVPAFLKETQ